MKRSTKKLLVFELVLAAVLCVLLFGCEVYLPADMRVALDERITQLEDVRDDAECRDLLAKDLAFLTDLREAVKP